MCLRLIEETDARSVGDSHPSYKYRHETAKCFPSNILIVSLGRGRNDFSLDPPVVLLAPWALREGVLGS